MGACESGLGRAEISSEYVGLSNVFLAAGVRYVIGSLWKVNQLATAILLGRFFDLVSSTSMSLPVALNGAQRETAAMTHDQLAAWVADHLPTLEQRLGPSLAAMGPAPFADPYFWAGFYVSGDI
jgi:CHAT domain-containing protein